MLLNNRNAALSVLLTLAAVLPRGHAQTFDEQYSHWPETLKIGGRVLIDNGLADFESMRPVLRRLSGGRRVVCFVNESDSADGMVDALRDAVGENGEVVLVRSKSLPADLVSAAAGSADVILASHGASQVDSLIGLKSSLTSLVDGGGTLIVNGALSEALGEAYLKPAPEDQDAAHATEQGLNLLLNCLLVRGAKDQGPSQDELLAAVSARPRTVGVALEHGALLLLSGRTLVCYGSGKATFVLPGADPLPPRVESLGERKSGRRPAWETVFDLTEWRRDAIDRAVGPFPPANPPEPMVDNGTLLVVGGGGMPKGLMDRFVELAGGPDKARLVYVPCSEADEVRPRQGMLQAWERMGVKHATMIHTKDRRRANSDVEFLKPLTNATGIWFGGGRQWNMADSYYGTAAHKLMKQVLQRGGVIGGSSAGASIQARYLARATPVGNMRIMAPGYERGGLGFIGGVAIDQHFSQRGRQKDMTQLMARHPQLLGIGIDEATAIEVSKSIATVTGRGKVFFYNRKLPLVADQPDYIALPAGSRYDLSQRKVLVDAGAKE